MSENVIVALIVGGLAVLCLVVSLMQLLLGHIIASLLFLYLSLSVAALGDL